MMYGDANNLYDAVMSQNLQCVLLRLDKTATHKNILKTPDNSPKGYIVEVALEFP